MTENDMDYRDRALCADYLAGDSSGELAKKYNLTRQRVCQVLIKCGVERRFKGAVKLPQTLVREARVAAAKKAIAERDALMAAQYKTGLSQGDLAQLHKLSLPAVMRRLRKSGVTMRTTVEGRALYLERRRA